MSTSDSLDEDELAADLSKQAFPARKAASSQVVQLTSTLKVVHNNYFWAHLFVYLSNYPVSASDFKAISL